MQVTASTPQAMRRLFAVGPGMVELLAAEMQHESCTESVSTLIMIWLRLENLKI
jgi:hypothetical protein